MDDRSEHYAALFDFFEVGRFQSMISSLETSPFVKSLSACASRRLTIGRLPLPMNLRYREPQRMPRLVRNSQTACSATLLRVHQTENGWRNRMSSRCTLCVIATQWCTCQAALLPFACRRRCYIVLVPVLKWWVC